MVREYEDVPSDNLLLVLDPSVGLCPLASASGSGPLASASGSGPLAGASGSGGAAKPDAFEDAVSLAATVCWEWCRHTGDRLIVAVADGGEVLDGLAGPTYGRRVLERLAVVQAGQEADGSGLAERLAAFSDVPAAAVLVSAGPSRLAGVLGRTLHRGVTCLDAAAWEDLDFYRPPR
jgi:hypothetical protein